MVTDRIVGVDFDNTIAGYDDLMHAIACERGLIAREAVRNKKLIRDAIRSLPDGETHWRSLQVTAYGPRMHEARPIPGVKDFLAECRRRNVPVYVVSHKTEFANFGESGVNLRLVARRWLEQQGFFDEDQFGLTPDRVFFESTREDKIARIATLGATHFIDDLEETFLEDAFPQGVQKILLTATQPSADTSAAPFSTWAGIRQHMFGVPDPAAIALLLRASAVSIERIGRGGNSKVYRATCPDGSRYVAKCYYQRTMDGRDRLEVEFSSLEFVWARGVHCVPQPVIADRAMQIALYEYVDGEGIDSRAVTAADVDQVVEFAGRLKRLAPSEAASALPDASEACFSFAALEANLNGRVDRLRGIQGQMPSYGSLQRFLGDDFMPVFDETIRKTKERTGARGWTAELPAQARTLSPSDMGFHNALRRADGSIIFLDFEYFGRDDPAKMIADFPLHPAMDLPDSAKERYVDRMLACFSDDRDLPERLARLSPLFVLKWCLILLNEFVPKFLARREFAAETSGDHEHVRLRQLGRAQQMLKRAMVPCPLA